MVVVLRSLLQCVQPWGLSPVCCFLALTELGGKLFSIQQKEKKKLKPLEKHEEKCSGECLVESTNLFGVVVVGTMFVLRAREPLPIYPFPL